MTVTLNGREVEVEVDRLGVLLATLPLPEDRRGVAVAINGTVVRRSEWDDTTLADGDVIELVGAVQGG